MLSAHPFPVHVQRYAHVQETQKEIMGFAHDMCFVFPGFVEQCWAYVDTYGALFLVVIQQYLFEAPDIVCSRMGFCHLH